MLCRHGPTPTNGGEGNYLLTRLPRPIDILAFIDYVHSMKQLKLGRKDIYALVDSTFNVPDGSLILASTGYPKIMKSTGKKRNSGSYIYDEKYLHRIVVGDIPSGFEVDHINGNKLDNRRENLRICSRIQNSHNTSNRKGRFKGVYPLNRNIKNGKVWGVQLTHKYKVYSLGRFKSEIDAAIAYNEKAKELYGEYARLNIID